MPNESKTTKSWVDQITQNNLRILCTDPHLCSNCFRSELGFLLKCECDNNMLQHNLSQYNDIPATKP